MPALDFQVLISGVLKELFSRSRDERQSVGAGPARVPASDEAHGTAADRRQLEVPAQRAPVRAPQHGSHVENRRRPRSGQYPPLPHPATRLGIA